MVPDIFFKIVNLRFLLFQADIFGAGTDTTLTSILWVILVLAR